jgi:hypothetical protein
MSSLANKTGSCLFILKLQQHETSLIQLDLDVGRIVGLSEIHAQDTPAPRPLQISFYDNATLFPGSDQWGVWGLPVHPGVTLGTEFYYRKQSSSDVFQSVRVGYHFQRFIQHSVLLYSELGYRQKWNPHLVGRALRWRLLTCNFCQSDLSPDQ